MALETSNRERTGLTRRNAFFALWAITTAGLTLFLQQGFRTFDSPATLPTLIGLLLCTAALLWWLPAPPIDDQSGAAVTRHGRFALLMVVAVVALFALATLLGPPLLFGLPPVAVVVLIALRPGLDKRAFLYALSLALVTGVAGLGAGWIDQMAPAAWAALQVALVATCLPAGWVMLGRAKVQQVGLSRYLREGTKSALQGFGLGILLGMPWALGIVVLGGSVSESWVQYPWQPFVAIQPAISEEAWGRVMLVPLLFLFLRRTARGKVALVAATLIMAYWFAYLHTSRDLSASTLINTLMIGTLYGLPVSYLWLRRDLETAIGFHFWQDFIKFGFAYLFYAGLWPI